MDLYFALIVREDLNVQAVKGMCMDNLGMKNVISVASKHVVRAFRICVCGTAISVVNPTVGNVLPI